MKQALNFVFFFLSVLNIHRMTFCECYETMMFLLPDTIDEMGSKCLQFSTTYCLYGYDFQNKQSSRAPQKYDSQLLSAILRSDDLWKSLNWFDLSNTSKTVSCCNFQVENYKTFGQDYGISPFFYMEKLTNYDPADKKLNKLEARFSKELCMNIITSVGFGTGDLKLVGPIKNNTDFLIVDRSPITGFSYDIKVHRISHKIPRTQLHFKFFKSTFVCKEQPWICETK
ncbi:uncharacterized protein LOC142336937 [Convolutriloba macropyga]|uniref:uncharacterized protein LOC142336937 n=1 Tax=Convolutriloba macropyga TaxID=536237 RepID=UPI003F52187B